MRIGEILKTHQIKSEEYDWRKEGKKMSDYFGAKCYFVFSHYHPYKIQQAFEVCQKNNKKNLGYLLGVLRKS